MILKGWHLESYGIFTDRTLDDLGPGMTVLHGPNEAGKSTLLHFIRGVLFGYPTRKQEGKGYIPNLGSGVHGGRLFIEDEAGKGRWILERRVSGNRATLLRPDGSKAELNELDGLLHHADKTLFKSVFTFELSDLVALEGKDTEKVRDSLFSAGISGAGKSASALGTLLKSEMEGLYKKSGKTTKLNVLLSELEIEQAALKELVTKAKGYTLQKVRLEELSAKAVKVREERDTVAAEVTRLGLLGKLAPLLRDQDELERKIAALSAPDAFPVEGVARMEVQLEKIRSAELGLGKLERRQSALEEEIGTFKVDEGLLGAAYDAVWLQETLTLHRDRMDRFLKTERETAVARADFAQTLEELGKWWSAEKVGAVDIGPERQAEVKGLEKQLTEAAQELDFAKRSLEDKSAAKSAPAPSLAQLVALMALAALLGVGGFLAPEGVGPLLWVGALIVAAFSAWRFKAGAKTAAPAQDGCADSQSAYDEASALWQTSLKRWGLTEGTTASPETAIHLITELRGAKKELGELKKKEKEEADLRDALAAWEEGAHERLPAASGSTAEKLVEEVRGFIREAMGELKKKEAADKLREDLDTVTASLGEPRDIKADAEKELASLFEIAGAEDEERFRQKAKDVQLNNELVSGLATVKAQLLTLVGEGVEAEALIAETRTGLQEDRRNGWREASERQGALEEELAETNRSLGGLKHELDELEGSTRLAECQARLEGLREQANALARQWRVAALTRALVRSTLDEYAAENQPEALARASELFSTLTDGRYLRVVHSPEDDQLLVTRPDGAQLGADQLSRGTREGLYICLRLALADQHGQRWGRRLPLVMDDVLVNLDPARAEATLKALAHFAKENQVLFFTCHPETVERIKSVDDTVRVFDL